ncbi:MAG: DegT/DnrJ/EryC1/StrS family aminotransferase [Chitinispirillaceae bacterium]|nr:DegT/DnrJ/EryC1/StrS family aminotransferase [Chitinispirillaceae bacterium]
MIPHSKPLVGQEEYAALRRITASGQLAQGAEVSRLETELCAFVGHRSGLAVASGTTALYAALRALGVTKGDSVIIPSYACTALANAVCMSGAQPILCDVEYDNALMSVNTVKAALARNTRAVIVPHLFGHPAPAHAIERELGIPVVEDCAQCIGADIDGRRTGSLTSIAIFSFYATKVLCAGEGGLVAASDSRLARRLEDLRDYDNRDTWEPRINMKCSDVHAALARAQLRRLPSFIRRRRAIAERYRVALTDNTLAAPFPPLAGNIRPMHYRFIIRTSRRRRETVRRYFIRMGIACSRPVFKPFHRYIKQVGFPASDRLFEELLSIPLYPALSEQECRGIERALEGLKSAF